MAASPLANSKLKVARRALPLLTTPHLLPTLAARTQLWRRAAWTPVFVRAEERNSSSSSSSEMTRGCGEFAALRCHRTAAPGAEDDKDSLGAAAAAAAEFPSETSCSSSPSRSVGRMILWSDVPVRRRSKVYWGRPWNALDVGTAAVVLSMHGLCLFAPFAFTWGAVWTAMGLYFVTGLLGITLSFHRNLAHRSFRLPKWLEYAFAYCGVQALQGNPLDWVSTHRYHHQHCDSERDPHSPIEGFWFSHMSWLFDTASVIRRCGEPNNVGDLEKQPFYRFLRQTYMVHPIALALLLYALGGFPYLVWGMGVRTVWVYHITWLVNSACHVWGHQAWDTGDLSRNNWWVAVLAFGEGWHNNHHAFEYSARHGLEWWQVDLTWYVVWLLQALGLATDVRVPTRAGAHGKVIMPAREKCRGARGPSTTPFVPLKSTLSSHRAHSRSNNH